MTDPSPLRPERIDLSKSDDHRDVVHRAVAALVQGGLVGFSQGGSQTVCAAGLQPNAMGSLLAAVDSAPHGTRPVLLLRGPGELQDWVPKLSKVGERLTRRAWPGPVVLTVEQPESSGIVRRFSESSRAAFVPPNALRVQVPAERFLRDLVKLVPGPVVSLRLAAPPASSEGPAGPSGFPELGLLIESPGGEPNRGSTEVRLHGDDWEVVRPGAVSSGELSKLVGTIILFVCTGNTCRSPMAEALCKVLLGKKLGCTPGEVESKGYVVLSAGIAAISGMPAASNAIAAVKSRGGSLEGHTSRKLTIELVRNADQILTMTSDHLEALLDRVPEVADKTRMLHPVGDDVADPVGADLHTYQRAADAIESYLKHWLGSFEL